MGVMGDPFKINKFKQRTERKYNMVLSLFGKQISEKVVCVWRCYSFEAVWSLEDKSLDWVYIDANHRYAPCLLDIQMWTAKIKKGGYVMLHDFTMAIWNGGVIEAVKYAIRRPGQLQIIGKDEERCSTIVLKRERLD